MIEEGKFVLNEDTGEEIDIKQSDFEFVQKDKKIHDIKFSGKATTFFKDAMKRFVKSKPAFAGGIIVGILILMSLIVPECTGNVGAFNVDRNSAGGDVSERLIQPKLFPAGTGFWDGTIRKSDILYNEETETPNGYREGSFSELEIYEKTADSYGELGYGGYVNVYCSDNTNLGNLYTNEFLTFDLSSNYNLDIELLNEQVIGYTISPFRVSLVLNGENSPIYYLTDNGGDGFINTTSFKVNINKALEEKVETSAEPFKARVRIEVQNQSSSRGNILIESISLTSDSKDEEIQTQLKNYSFDDANQMLLKKKEDQGFWTSTGGKTAYKVNFTYCSFLYDQYEDIYGVKTYTYTNNGLLDLETKGQIALHFNDEMLLPATKDPEVLAQRFEITDNSPIIKIIEQVGDAKYNVLTKSYEGYTLVCEVYGYRLLGYDSMPIFLFGTNTNRKDYFKLIFTSLRFSFLLAIGVSAVNIIFGLIWGSISGYFGGWTDILMERFCEILSSLPSTVIITLCILYGKEWNWGDMSDIIALMVALFMTGWMGVAARTRTQFYRFKGREYVLASRTLGAKDTRLIFRHILPNSMGTIITGSILMIPSVVYTEASIAYLKLGLQGQNMFGVILSEANAYYQGENTFILIIPTLIMAFLLVSFNLFGNGLRDAFNPQLKGSN